MLYNFKEIISLYEIHATVYDMYVQRVQRYHWVKQNASYGTTSIFTFIPQLTNSGVHITFLLPNSNTGAYLKHTETHLSCSCVYYRIAYIRWASLSSFLSLKKERNDLYICKKNEFTLFLRSWLTLSFT